MHHARLEIHSRGAIDGEHGHRQFMRAIEQRRGGVARRTLRPGAEDGIDHDADVGPWTVGCHLAHALGARQRGDMRRQRSHLAGERRHRDRHAEARERPRHDPAVAAVVSRAGEHQHALPCRRRETRAAARRRPRGRRIP
jgi:hypothetical protein